MIIPGIVVCVGFPKSSSTLWHYPLIQPMAALHLYQQPMKWQASRHTFNLPVVFITCNLSGLTEKRVSVVVDWHIMQYYLINCQLGLHYSDLPWKHWCTLKNFLHQLDIFQLLFVNGILIVLEYKCYICIKNLVFEILKHKDFL